MAQSPKIDAAVPKVTPKMAQRVYDHFHPPGTRPGEETPVASVAITSARVGPAETED